MLIRQLRVWKYSLYKMLDLKRNDNNGKKVISIIGTTGVGKSQLSIELAKRINGEIINADSMQMYKGLDQITNKHPIEERENIPHHVMNHVNWDEQYYIHRFQKECNAAMEDCWNRGKIPIIVGGTHYYLQSTLFNNKTIGSNEEFVKKEEDDGNTRSKMTKEQLKIIDSNDNELIFEKLKEIDPIIANKFHPNDYRRIKRALEVSFVRGVKASTIYEEQRKDSLNSGTSLKYDTLFFWIYSEMEELDQRLDERVDKMMLNGGVKELIDLYKFYLEEKRRGNESVEKMDVGIWQVIGFKEFLPYLEKNGTNDLLDINNIVNLEERDEAIRKLINEDKEFSKCCDEMKLKTRRYARKQVKWIRNLLGPELQEEENNGFVKFGKMFVLDATDLTKWGQRVGERGVNITNEFLSKGYVNDNCAELAAIPTTLCHIDNLIKKNDTSSLNKVENWTHHECEVCRDRETNKPIVYVGEQWDIHLKSKKHRFNLNRGKRKREYEEWLKKSKKEIIE